MSDISKKLVFVKKITIINKTEKKEGKTKSSEQPALVL